MSDPIDHGDDSDKRSSEPKYKVGYKKPPKHTRFKKGQSGNKKGRPPNKNKDTDLNFRQIILDELNEKIPIRSGNEIREMTKFRAYITQLLNDSFKGKISSQKTIAALIKEMGLLEFVETKDSGARGGVLVVQAPCSSAGEWVETFGNDEPDTAGSDEAAE